MKCEWGIHGCIGKTSGLQESFLWSFLYAVTSVHLQKGNRKELNAKIKPALASNKDVIWESDDTSVVEVDSDGLVTAKKEGVANVKAISAGARMSKL